MTEIRLLTWNIWMMPSWTSESPKNTERARAIADELLERDFHIICFQKAFDGDAREVLKAKLGARYKHRFGPVNGAAGLKINGGVWVLSQLPLADHREILFRDSAGIEGFSRKGAMLLRGSIDGHAFSVASTHLQGDDRAAYNPSHQLVRNNQMEQMARELINPFADPASPLFVCGDFSTPRRDPKDPFSESQSYRNMLTTFAAVNGPEERITLDDHRVHNDLANDDSGRQAELDYILVHDPWNRVRGHWDRIIFRNQTWDGPHGRRDLSYRYAVGATFTFT